MPKFKRSASWVVFVLNSKTGGMTGVCEQGEWDAMELAQPGRQTLIRNGIASEGEAEQYARKLPPPSAPPVVPPSPVVVPSLN